LRGYGKRFNPRVCNGFGGGDKFADNLAGEWSEASRYLGTLPFPQGVG
jgi:hypothetical protein